MAVQPVATSLFPRLPLALPTCLAILLPLVKMGDLWYPESRDLGNLCWRRHLSGSYGARMSSWYPKLPGPCGAPNVFLDVRLGLAGRGAEAPKPVWATRREDLSAQSLACSRPAGHSGTTGPGRPWVVAPSSHVLGPCNCPVGPTKELPVSTLVLVRQILQMAGLLW